MLKLTQPNEPFWLDLPYGVRLKLRPLTTALMNAALHRAKQIAATWREDESIPTSHEGYLNAALVTGLAQCAILEWEGVVDESSNPLAVNDDHIAQLMDIWLIADQFWQSYWAKMEAWEAEGNASAPSVAGTMAAAGAIAKTAKQKTSHVAKQSPTL